MGNHERSDRKRSTKHRRHRKDRRLTHSRSPEATRFAKYRKDRRHSHSKSPEAARHQSSTCRSKETKRAHHKGRKDDLYKSRSMPSQTSSTRFSRKLTRQPRHANSPIYLSSDSEDERNQRSARRRSSYSSPRKHSCKSDNVKRRNKGSSEKYHSRKYRSTKRKKKSGRYSSSVEGRKRRNDQSKERGKRRKSRRRLSNKKSPYSSSDTNGSFSDSTDSSSESTDGFSDSTSSSSESIDSFSDSTSSSSESTDSPSSDSPISVSSTSSWESEDSEMGQKQTSQREEREREREREWEREQAEGGEEARRWRERLAEEMGNEYSESWGQYESGTHDYYDDFGDDDDETHSDWADRMNREWHQKKQSSYPTSHNNRRGKRGQPADDASGKKRKKLSDEAKREFDRKTREEFQKKYEQMQADMQRGRTERLSEQKKLYEKRCHELFSRTSERRFALKDIPWPFLKGKGIASMSEFLFCDLGTDTAARKKYLKQQQIRWHPDKFVQRCGNRLVEKDREEIMKRVKEISQQLNKLVGSLGAGH